MTGFSSNDLNFSYPLSAGIFVNTYVFGDSRDEATVTIVYNESTVWTVTLTQKNVVAMTPELVLGSMTIKQGMSFEFNIPLPESYGNVLMAGGIVSPPNPVQVIEALVASWPFPDEVAAE